MSNSEFKKAFLEQLLRIWSKPANEDLSFGQFIINAFDLARRKNQDLFSGNSFDIELAKTSDKVLYNFFMNYYFATLNLCCGEKYIVFSGESFDNEWLFVCKKCGKEDTYDGGKDWMPSNTNRKLFLETIKKNHPKSDSIPPLLERIKCH